MGAIFLCFGVFVIGAFGLGAILFNCLSARLQDTTGADRTCLILGVALSSIITGLLAMALGV